MHVHVWHVCKPHGMCTRSFRRSTHGNFVTTFPTQEEFHYTSKEMFCETEQIHLLSIHRITQSVGSTSPSQEKFVEKFRKNERIHPQHNTHCRLHNIFKRGRKPNARAAQNIQKASHRRKVHLRNWAPFKGIDNATLSTHEDKPLNTAILAPGPWRRRVLRELWCGGEKLQRNFHLERATKTSCRDVVSWVGKASRGCGGERRFWAACAQLAFSVGARGHDAGTPRPHRRDGGGAAATAAQLWPVQSWCYWWRWQRRWLRPLLRPQRRVRGWFCWRRRAWVWFSLWRCSRSRQCQVHGWVCW